MWREALTFVGQPTLLSGRPRDTQEIEDGQRTRWRDDLDSKETTTATATATATAMGLLSKTTTLHLHDAFLYISLPSLYDNDMKMPNFTHNGGRKQATTNFSFLFLNLGAVLKKSTLKKFA